MEVFEIPSHKSELDVDDDSSKQNVISNLEDARKKSRDGPAYIIDCCRAYFSVIYYSEKLPVDIIHIAFEDLHRGMKALNEKLATALTNLNDEEDEKADQSTQTHYLNIIKIFVYCYTQIIISLERKEEEKNMNTLKIKRKKAENDNAFALPKKQIMVHLNNLLQHEIKQLWTPPIVEETFINLISEVCYRFLQNSSVKSEKDVCTEIWSFLGTLIKNYNHGKTFVIRIVQLIKLHEHLIHCLPEGFKFLVENYNCKSMIHDIIQEVTEWQTDEKYQDAQGARFCSSIVVEMAILMPNMMIPEVLYLTRYLYYESPTLRNCVLAVITEIILKVLTKHEMTEEEKQSRDTFLSLLEEHILDVSPLVRSKVLQHFARLQEESAIPRTNQNQILTKIVPHLRDKGATVRKSALNLITTFVSHNLFSSNLEFHKRKIELDEIEAKLKATEVETEEMLTKDAEQLEEKWKTIEEDIKKAVVEEFEKEPEVKNTENAVNNQEDMFELIKSYLVAGEYKNAIKLCRTAEDVVKDWKTSCEAAGDEGKVEMTTLLLKSVFVKQKSTPVEELYQRLELLGQQAEFSRDVVQFLSLIDSALETIVEFLETTAIGDMHEAIKFFTTAYQFNLDRSTLGIVAMLKIMQRNEQERKDAIVEAFKSIYLKTDTSSNYDHPTTVANRLILLLKNVPNVNLEDLQSIISEWAKKGLIDNSVIDVFWQFFTNKASVLDEDRAAALELLRMASLNRISIIQKNVKLISTVAFEKKDGKAQKCMFLVAIACRALAVAGSKPINMKSKDPPFKINAEDETFNSLSEILIVNFFKELPYYNYALESAVNCIYQLCSKPEIVCERIFKGIKNRLIEKDEKELPDFQLVRMCIFLSSVAINHLDYMDNTLYKELKRREYVREEKKSDKEKKDISKKKNNSKLPDSVLNQSQLDESTLEGAQAEDSDAEFIVRILENDTVTGCGLLGKMSFIPKLICQRPDIYDTATVQGVAIINLIRFMLVSSKFCEDNIQLLFTIFEKTTFVDAKCTVLYHCSDLLTRFPNIVEPWTPRIYQSLQDPSGQIRKATFFTLSNLILRDMIRVQGHISELAKCIIDKDSEINSMSRAFFVQLSHKENNLYNILPDIFSHLLEQMESDDLRTIMKFLFGLMDKQKYMENFVERFCVKFQTTENNTHCRNIVYCLTLIHYNDKALRKLQENFPAYKHLVHDEEIYSNFKQILSNCNRQQIGKVDLKPIVSELEQSIEDVFEITENDKPRPPPRPVASAKKKRAPAKKRTQRGRRKKQQNSSASSDSSDSN